MGNPLEFSPPANTLNMSHPKLDRSRLRIRKLECRPSKVEIVRDAVPPETEPRALSTAASEALAECVAKIRAARLAGRPVMLAFGAHTIKNGLAPVLIQLIEQGWVTLLATNGAGIIHDWEFAFQGLSSEDVRANVDQGQFGIWEETGYGKHGSFEGLCSGAGIAKMASECPGLPTDAAGIFQAAAAGDNRAVRIVSRVADSLGCGIALLIDILNPEAIVIGSIFARQESLLRPGMEAAIAREALPGAARRCRILPSRLGETVGDFAALAIAIEAPLHQT